MLAECFGKWPMLGYNSVQPLRGRSHGLAGGAVWRSCLLGMSTSQDDALYFGGDQHSRAFYPRGKQECFSLLCIHGVLADGTSVSCIQRYQRRGKPEAGGGPWLSLRAAIREDAWGLLGLRSGRAGSLISPATKSVTVRSCSKEQLAWEPLNVRSEQ